MPWTSETLPALPIIGSLKMCEWCDAHLASASTCVWSGEPQDVCDECEMASMEMEGLMPPLCCPHCEERGWNMVEEGSLGNVFRCPEHGWVRGVTDALSDV